MDPAHLSTISTISTSNSSSSFSGRLVRTTPWLNSPSALREGGREQEEREEEGKEDGGGRDGGGRDGGGGRECNKKLFFKII